MPIPAAGSVDGRFLGDRWTLGVVKTEGKRWYPDGPSEGPRRCRMRRREREDK
jgi:hypothetical protein